MSIYGNNLFNNIILFDSELLNEESIYDYNSKYVKGKRKIKICLDVDGMKSAGENYVKDPYIKIYDGPYGKSAVTRISMKDCRVIDHNINTKEKKTGIKRNCYTGKIIKD